jgi:hypothetical protein
LGATEWAKYEKEFDNIEELEAFAVRKVSELDKYNKALEKRKEDKALVNSGKIIKEVFITNALIEPGCLSCFLSFVVNNEMRNNEGLFYKVAATKYNMKPVPV